MQQLAMQIPIRCCPTGCLNLLSWREPHAGGIQFGAMRHAKVACSRTKMKVEGMGGIMFSLVPMPWEGVPELPNQPATSDSGQSNPHTADWSQDLDACLIALSIV